MFKKAPMHQCNNCRKFIPKWEAITLTKIQYSPGEKFEQCSSNIKTKTKKIATLCQECMQELEELYSLESLN